MAQLVGCWTRNPRVMGLIPGNADCFMWDNIPEGTETDNLCEKVLKPRPGCRCKVE